MRRLRPGGVAIPRAFRNHKSPEGRAYAAYCLAMLDRLGALPDSAAVTLREAGRLAIELQAMGTDLEQARGRHRRRDVSRLRRAMLPARTQLLNLERRLEELAKTMPACNPIEAVHEAVRGANVR